MLIVSLSGVNSDPTRDDEASVTKVVDERRSKGALCASSAINVHETLPLFLSGTVPPQIRTRIRCVVKRSGGGDYIVLFFNMCVCVCVFVLQHLHGDEASTCP